MSAWLPRDDVLSATNSFCFCHLVGDTEEETPGNLCRLFSPPMYSAGITACRPLPGPPAFPPLSRRSHDGRYSDNEEKKTGDYGDCAVEHLGHQPPAHTEAKVSTQEDRRVCGDHGRDHLRRHFFITSFLLVKIHELLPEL